MAIEQHHASRPGASRLTGESVVMRPVAITDLPILEAWDEDPDIIALMGQKYGTISTDEWFRMVSSSRNCRAMVIETSEGRLIGELELAQLNWRAGTTEVRICIGEKDCWGRGFGSEALRLSLQLAFEGYGLRVVYLRVFETNSRAIRLYERTGFRTEAILQPSARRGDPAAVLLMKLTRDRWARLQAHSA